MEEPHLLNNQANEAFYFSDIKFGFSIVSTRVMQILLFFFAIPL